MKLDYRRMTIWKPQNIIMLISKLNFQILYNIIFKSKYFFSSKIYIYIFPNIFFIYTFYVL